MNRTLTEILAPLQAVAQDSSLIGIASRTPMMDSFVQQLNAELGESPEAVRGAALMGDHISSLIMSLVDSTFGDRNLDRATLKIIALQHAAACAAWSVSPPVAVLAPIPQQETGEHHA